MKSREKSIFQVLQNKHFSRNSRDLCLWSWVKHDYIERLLWPFPKSYIFQSLLGLFQGFLAFSNASWPFPRLFGLFQVQSFLGLFQSLAFSNVSGLFAMPFPKHVCLLPFPRHGQPLGFAFSKASCCNLVTSSQPKPFPRPHELRQQVFSKTHNFAPNHVCLLLFPKHAKLFCETPFPKCHRLGQAMPGYMEGGQPQSF